MEIDLMINIALFIATFVGMEFVAWALHKYVMHGFLWNLHEDHHIPTGRSFQKNDWFAIFFAIPSWLLLNGGYILGSYRSVWIGTAILMYGVVYFLVHEVFIHQRKKWFRNSDNWYLRGLRRAHKMHHKKISKEDGECFGMLLVPFKYFKEEMQQRKTVNN